MSQSRPPSQITTADVAERAVASITTVSRVISQAASMALKTEAQVRAATTELNHRPHPTAQGAG